MLMADIFRQIRVFKEALDGGFTPHQVQFTSQNCLSHVLRRLWMNHHSQVASTDLQRNGLLFPLLQYPNANLPRRIKDGDMAEDS
jgi:hypothetical protein